ncbi:MULTISPECIES: helix-turn-helix domain-containing protein [unclassified Polaromonas]|uniref:helix-turn-helix domain-containing protein n=1 Tax=unclassified Polaromonas TaxID=2638319 RepID=UPI0013DDC68B|nr:MULTISPECIES: helix-turn-helix domain-containing protein [unclassified Polaromonas]
MITNKSTPLQEDMHPADVIAALRKRGTSLRKIAMENGYSHIQRVLTSPWLAAEQLVAKALDKRPEDLWPSRYVNPDDRRLAFRQTRRIVLTDPCAPPCDVPPEAQASRPVPPAGATPEPAPRRSK